MTKEEFLKTLTWIESEPPISFNPIEYNSKKSFTEKDRNRYYFVPIICENKFGKIFIVNSNSYLYNLDEIDEIQCKDCREFIRDDVVRYAYLWEI